MSNKKAAEARRKAFEREEKIWKRDKFAFIAVEVSGAHIGTDSISYAITSRRYNSRRHSSLTYRFSVLEDSSYEKIVQVSEKEGKELEETLDREKTYIIRLYKHSGLLASIEEKQYERNINVSLN